MTRDQVTLFVLHASPAEISKLAAFIQNGCKAVAPVAAVATWKVEREFITYPEAAKMIGCSPSTVRRLRNEGEIKIAVVRGRAKVVRSTVLAYLERVMPYNAPVTTHPAKSA